ncbi:hypothetical protein F5Y04DRAFT_56133 [Hypomontagnella monticulosa]|nr:hypothetical protein F5Y04DRAFT_56133 [Hypomontagnella monticulosa]
MITIRWALGAIIAATAVSASTDELQFFSRLLKRQEPGTPAYNCHDNCGQAIIQGRNSADVCNDNIFLTDYQNCLQCAGPDNVNIWQYYGNTLSRTASTCGLSTTPLSGKQPDVGPAIPAGSGSASSSSSSAPPSSSSTTEGTTQTSVTEPTSAPEPTNTDSSSSSSQGESSATSGAGEVTSASSIGTSASSGSSAGYPTASATESSSKTSASGGVTTPYPTTTGTGSGAGNGTATTSSGIVVVTGGANAFAASNVGFYGALALGALYVAAQ